MRHSRILFACELAGRSYEATIGTDGKSAVQTFSERMIGKSIRSVERSEPGFGISVLFSDGTGLTVYTEVSLHMRDNAGGSYIERVTSTDERITLHLGGDDFVAISIDRQKHDAVELFVYQDTDGTFIVEN